MKTSVYIRCLGSSPSGYYRILQYVKELNLDYETRELMPRFFYEYYLRYKKKEHLVLNVLAFLIVYFRVLFFLIVDNCRLPESIVVSREFSPRVLIFPMAFLLKRISKRSKLIWDFDDNIVEGREISKREFTILSEYSSTIVVTHEYLMQLIDKQFHSKVRLLPTTDGDMRICNLKKITDSRKKTFETTIRLIWVATAVNIPHLTRILPVLDEAAYALKSDSNKQLLLSVVSSESVEYLVKDLIIDNIKWSSEKAIDAMCRAHIGIMPLMDSPYSRGKGGFKLVQYMSAGLPILASDVGFNKNVVTPQCGFLINDLLVTDGWKTALLELVNNFGDYLSYSRESHRRWEEHFSYEKNLRIWENLLQS